MALARRGPVPTQGEAGDEEREEETRRFTPGGGPGRRRPRELLRAEPDSGPRPQGEDQERGEEVGVDVVDVVVDGIQEIQDDEQDHGLREGGAPPPEKHNPGRCRC
jgi:hypothetical protein